MNVQIDISNTILTTKRLILRPWRLTDLDDFFEYASVDGVGQMAGWPPHENKETSLKILNSFIEHKKVYAIEYRGKVIGSLGIEEYDQGKFPELDYVKARELGFVLSKDYWGKGLMPEAVKAVIRYLFEEIKLDVITCGHFPENKQSASVQKKCGFTFCKNAMYQSRMGTIVPEVCNILTKEDWLAGKPTYDRSLNCADAFSACGCLEEWIHSYLTTDGNNQPFSDGLKLVKRYFTGPILFEMDKLERCCGPEEGMKYPVDPDAFEKRVGGIADALMTGASVPPLIVNYSEHNFTVNDGNHRLEALNRLKIGKYPVVFWFTDPKDLFEFHREYGEYL